MHDSSKVIPAIVLFLLIITSPLWYNMASGRASYVPELKIDTTATHCVESKDYMRANHMHLLNIWRDEVVRGHSRIYEASDGEEYEKSLTKTCMKCHKKQSDFCARCHDYAGVEQPKCWDCHNETN